MNKMGIKRSLEDISENNAAVGENMNSENNMVIESQGEEMNKTSEADHLDATTGNGENLHSSGSASGNDLVSQKLNH